MTFLGAVYSCNMCGETIEIRQPKFIVGSIDGEGEYEKMDIHICKNCSPEFVDFANGKRPPIKNKK